MGLFKLLSWLFILGIIAYVSISVYLGTSGNVGGNAIATGFHEGRQVEILTMPECMDTDDGKVYYQLGHTYNTHDNKIYDDYCEDDKTLAEYFCNNQYPDRIFVSCNCFKGACY